MEPISNHLRQIQGDEPVSEQSYYVEGVVTGKAGQMLQSLINSDEPFFILRAKDIFSVMAIGKYLNIIYEYGPIDSGMEEGIVEALKEIRTWQINNPERVRYPD